MSNHWKKLQILREQGNSTKSVKVDHKALKAKFDEDEFKPEGGVLGQQKGNLSTNNSEVPQPVKCEEVHKAVEDSWQPSICKQKIPKSNQIHDIIRDSKFDDLALDDVYVASLISMMLTTKYTDTKQLKPLPVVMEPYVSLIKPLP